MMKIEPVRRQRIEKGPKRGFSASAITFTDNEGHVNATQGKSGLLNVWGGISQSDIVSSSHQ
jgi:hypothetical protein